MAFGRNREYNAGNTVGRTFDDGQGAKLLRPENRCEFVDVGKDKGLNKLRDALVFAGIMQAAPEGSSVDMLVLENTEAGGDPGVEDSASEPKGEALDAARETATDDNAKALEAANKGREKADKADAATEKKEAK